MLTHRIGWMAQIPHTLHRGGISAPNAGRPPYTSSMRLRNAALFAFIGMTLLTVLLAAGFIRDLSAFMSGAVAAIAVLTSGVHLLASFSLAVFLFVFQKGSAA
jgi:hypothetical protein